MGGQIVGRPRCHMYLYKTLVCRKAKKNGPNQDTRWCFYRGFHSNLHIQPSDGLADCDKSSTHRGQLLVDFSTPD